MSKAHTEGRKSRPEFRNINIFDDLPHYRLPVTGVVSILHRISGLLLFLLLPLVVWLFDTSVSSGISFEVLRSVFAYGPGFMPAWLFKLILLGLLWAFLHHLCAGVRFLLIDTCHHVATKATGHKTAMAVLWVSLGLTLLLGAKLFGLY